MEGQTTPCGERVDGLVAALGDDRHGAGLAPGQGVPPERDAVRKRDDPVAVRPAHREVVAPRGGGELVL